ncbi:uncharacterized protein EV420DRAFT_1309047 [Desarmillaria tabescens]|uniref:HNH nuclease domain-containing protein n=1 Tax=Armillaria tabescens TaxID=1929756 RepID=A0AA39KE91_ARMTA|nr:uncharacterized protein EV420DRAFT_1309047 [Desarmillaria tabescens]KAK0458291.1 hypothetical protein EV420DRAFT_1309047 [Desarmillaria tabescens]
MSALPLDFRHPEPTVVSAYERCRIVEKNIMRQIDETALESELKLLNKYLVDVRILGYLLTFGPTIEAISHVADTTICCEDDDAVVKQGNFFDRYLLRTFRKKEVRTPSMSLDSSRPPFNNIQEMIKEDLIERPMNHSQAKKSALIRDNFRCVLSGAVDMFSYLENEEIEAQVHAQSLIVQETQCSHIFFQSTDISLSEDAKVSFKNFSSLTWTIIQHFGYSETQHELSGNSVHSLTNILTFESGLHTLFDTLKLWLEPTEIPNRYKVGTSVPKLIFELKKLPAFVEFTSTDSRLKLPSTEYLRLHAACCQVAHMSGAADYLEEMDKDKQELNYLAPGGGSAGMLVALLHDISCLQVSIARTHSSGDWSLS